MENKNKILIVDDAQINRQILIEILGNTYDYAEAENGRQAIHLLQDDLTVDLILLDINMPEMDGFQFLEQMQRFRWTDEIPVIVITADESKESIDRAYNLGVADYLNRPFDASIVRRRVENTLKLYLNQKRLTHLVADQVQEKEEDSNTIVGILSNVVEFRNKESGSHVQHIRSITELLLRRLVQKTDVYHLSETDISEIITASALHDVGKIGIPETILNKPGKLTEDEFSVIKTHTTIGYDMIRQVDEDQKSSLIRMALEICRWHHERWNGKGYPDGLRGEEIPIAAQVVAIADVFDALTSDRCYKQAVDPKTALSMIRNGECGAFSPMLLECLNEAADDLKRLCMGTVDVNEMRKTELSRLSAEIMESEKMPKSDRAQRLLESMQERIDFFASCSGGLQFEYDRLSGLATVTDWNEPPKSRKKVLNLKNPETIQCVGIKDIRRLEEAMEATGPENPEFSMSIQMPFEKEYHWCDLRIRTLWSSLQPDHYVGAVGHLKDPLRSNSRAPILHGDSADVKTSVSGMDGVLKQLRGLFDFVRLVDPAVNSVLELDESGILRHTDQKCGSFWGNDGSCTNCVSSRALAQKTMLNKLEFTEQDMYFVLAKYLSVNGMDCVLEMISKISTGRWIDANGTRFLLRDVGEDNLELLKDSLTGAYSRRYFDTYRQHLEGMDCVEILDVDRFKQVNDTYGHLVGDQVLKAIAKAIHSCIRNTDILIRYGGDEFLLLYPTLTEDKMEMKHIQIQKAVSEILIPEHPELKLSVSIGGVCGVHPITEAIRRADERMYRDKAARR